MSDRGETEAYLAAELDSLQQVHAAGDQAAVTRRIEHVRAEAGPEPAAILEQMLKEQEALRQPPAQPVFTPTSPPGGVRELPRRSRKFLVVFLAVAVVALLLVVTVLVTVIILRPPATTTASPPPQATGSPAETTTPPPTTATSTTSVSPPVAPSRETWTPVWSQLKRITMPGDGLYSVDLDTPQVTKEGSSYTDLLYDGSFHKLSQRGATLIGTGPATLPSPEDCFYDAQSLTVGTVVSKDMAPGKSVWCLVTKRGNLVWLHLVSGGGYPSGDPTLRFELMQWKKLD